MKKLLPFIFCLFVLSVVGQENAARKIDVFINATCEEYLARADAMYSVQTNNPNSKIYVFVYEGKQNKPVYKNGNTTSKSVLPPIGLATAVIQSMKARIQIRKFPLENYVFVNGGFREDFTVETWLVPPGAEPPKPTPTLKKMKYRKGKSKGFCLGCC